jgi:co-chaperonin GroES (HSP10)
MKPLKKNVLIAQMKKERKTETGLILTSDQGVSEFGKVLAVGSEVEYVEEGQWVVPDWGKGNVVTVDGMQCVVLAEEHIFGIVEDE